MPTSPGPFGRSAFRRFSQRFACGYRPADREEGAVRGVVGSRASVPRPFRRLPDDGIPLEEFRKLL